MTIGVSIVCVCAVLLLWLLLIANSLAVFNSASYMAASPQSLCRETLYLRRLPELLATLRNAGFPSPWPNRGSPLSVLLFRRKLLYTFRHSAPISGSLIQHHLSLWAFLRQNQTELGDAVFLLKHNRARRILAQSRISAQRDLALAFLNSARAQSRRIRLARPAIADARGLAPLKSLSALFSEHGYELDPRLTALLHLEAADDRSLLDELLQSRLPPRRPVKFPREHANRCGGGGEAVISPPGCLSVATGDTPSSGADFARIRPPRACNTPPRRSTHVCRRRNA